MNFERFTAGLYSATVTFTTRHLYSSRPPIMYTHAELILFSCQTNTARWIYCYTRPSITCIYLKHRLFQFEENSKSLWNSEGHKLTQEVISQKSREIWSFLQKHISHQWKRAISSWSYRAEWGGIQLLKDGIFIL